MRRLVPALGVRRGDHLAGKAMARPELEGVAPAAQRVTLAVFKPIFICKIAFATHLVWRLAMGARATPALVAHRPPCLVALHHGRPPLGLPLDRSGPVSRVCCRRGCHRSTSRSSRQAALHSARRRGRFGRRALGVMRHPFSDVRCGSRRNPRGMALFFSRLGDHEVWLCGI